ncbi:DUF2314 domain-containing protein [Clostridium sp. OS1-26]|uniref:DUF2314 domain-containing protein n=1 Tax=Clostridium sp. OS1-26 TaxID=3070681 RepID=UPI0035A8509A
MLYDRDISDFLCFNRYAFHYVYYTIKHIWFEVLEINGQKIKRILTQEPYYIRELTVNTEMELNLKDLTDWILYTPDGQITPDSVHLLEE